MSDAGVPSTGPAGPPIGIPLSLGTYTTTKDEIIEFARQWDPLSFHVDAAAASSGYFGEIIASGIHTLAIFQRLSALSHFGTWDVIAGKRVRDLKFTQPVRPGDALSGQIVVQSVTPDSRGRGHLVLDGSLRNQHGDLVLTLGMEILTRMRPGTYRSEEN